MSIVDTNSETFTQQQIGRYKTQAADWRNKYDTLAQGVIDATVDWTDGCFEGKKDFLESLGLQYPTSDLTFTFKVDVSLEYIGDEDSLHDDVSGYIEGYVADELDAYLNEHIDGEDYDVQYHDTRVEVSY